MRRSLAAGLLGGVLLCGAPQSPWIVQQSTTRARFRGISAVSSRIAWASGNHGVVARTLDGGVTWQSATVPDASDLDFRDIEAFDANTAYLLSIGPGTQSRIYKTLDGGQHWVQQFTNTNPKAFYDAMAFWDAEHGIAMSDPVEGKFALLTTDDGGAHWNALSPESLPAALPGEGAFAASGTCLITQGKQNAWFCTGGAVARVFRTADRGHHWTVAETPVVHGTEMAGLSSLAFRDSRNGVAVGGDYNRPESAENVIVRTSDGGRTWRAIAGSPPHGYRSCVAYLPGASSPTLVAVGLSGSDISTDDGETWTRIGATGYHTLSLKSAKSGWAAGDAGRIARFSFSPLLPQP